jgi:hypothetical protein
MIRRPRITGTEIAAMKTFGRQLMRSSRPRRDGSLRSMRVSHGRTNDTGAVRLEADAVAMRRRHDPTHVGRSEVGHDDFRDRDPCRVERLRRRLPRTVFDGIS